MMCNWDFKRAALTTLLILLACSTLLAQQQSPTPTGEIVGKRIIFADGATLDVDDTWKQGDTLWYRRQGTSQSTNRAVRKIENRYKENPAPTATPAPATPVQAKTPPVAATTWIYLVDGARLRVDEVREVSDGAWYNRGMLTVFIDRERIARIEREQPDASNGGDWKEHSWSSGNPTIDQLIKRHGAHF